MPKLSLSSEGMKELSRLWDEAQEIALADRAVWLERVPVSSPTLRAALKEMLKPVVAADAAPGEPPPALGAVPFIGFERLRAQLSDEAPAHDVDARLGSYRLVRELGSGGMATVWLAERADGLMQRQVAVKLPHAWLGARFLERFQQERQILASLAHPNIARLYDAGLTAQGRPYLVLEYVEGQSLTEYADQRGLSLRDRLALFLQVLDAVQFAHEHHVVHRDLKPSNVLVSSDGTAHLLDFGVARLLVEGDQDLVVTQLVDGAMTPAFAAPEQLEGAPVGPLADVYALGILLFKLLTGKLPYDTDLPTRAAVSAALQTGAVRLPSELALSDAKALRGNLDAIVTTAMRREPHRRFVSARAFADDVRRYLDGERVLSRPDSLGYKLARFVRRYRAIVISTALVVASLGAGLVVAWRSARDAHEQQRIAQEQARIANQNAHVAAETREFLVDLFNDGGVDSRGSRKSGELTARELLDIGAARIAKSFKDAPESRVRLMGVIGNLYGQLSLHEKAAQMLRERVALARALKATDGRTQVDALLDYGLALLNGEDGASPRSTLDEARAVLDRVTPARPEDGDLRGRLELEYAYMLFQSDQAEARRHLELAITLLKPLSDADNYGVALSFRGADEMEDLHLVRAIGTLDEALRVSDQDSAQRVQILSQLCRIHIEIGDGGDGLALCRQAHDIMRRQLGDASGSTVDFAGTLADMLIQAGQPEQARDILRRLLPALRALPPGVSKRDLGGVYELMASAEIHMGRPAAARQALKALERLRLDIGKTEGKVNVINAEKTTALVNLAQGRYDVALAAVSKFASSPPDGEMYGSAIEEMRAIAVRAQLGLGRVAAAESALLDTANATRWPNDEPSHPRSPRDLDLLLLHAQLTLARGALPEAQRFAADLRSRVESAPGASAAGRWAQPLEVVLGRIALAAGAFDAAATHFDKAAALSPPAAENSLITADAWAWQARARMARGDVAGARGLVAQANEVARLQGAPAFVIGQP